MALGYQGFARIFSLGVDPLNNAQPGGGRVLLTTGSSVNLVIEPIYSTAVFGSGWYNAPESAHYADSAIRFEGTVDFDFQASTTVWNFFRDWAIEQRAWPRSLSISPDGQNVFEYWVTDGTNPIAYGTGGTGTFNNFGAWASSLNFTTSAGAAVTSSAGVLAIFRALGSAGQPYIQNRTGFILGNPTSTDVQNLRPLNPGQANIDPIPFWKTNANLYTVAGDFNPYAGVPAESAPTPTTPKQAGTQTIDWSIDLTNNTVPLYVANGTRFPFAVLQGAISATGNATLFNNNGVFDPVGVYNSGTNSFNGASTAENTTFRVQIRTNAESNPTPTYVYLHLPAVVIETDDFGIKGQNDPVTRAFSMKALGGRIDSNNTQVFPPFYMSLAQ